jgi:HK97 family phage portal protein
MASGRQYYWIWRRTDGTPNEIYPIPTSWVVPNANTDRPNQNPEENRFIKDYEIRMGNGYVVKGIPPEDILDFRLPGAKDMTSTISPLASVYAAIQLQMGADQYAQEVMKNNRLPGIVFNQEETLGPKEQGLLRQAWEASFGPGKRGSPVFLGGKGTTLTRMNALEDISQKNLSDQIDAKLCYAMNIPPILVGCPVGLENSPWSNTGEARKWFAENTLIPMWAELGDSLSSLLSTLEREQGYELYFNTDSVNALQEDQASRDTRATQMVQGGWGTINDARELGGLEPDEKGGDYYMRNAGAELVPFGEEPPSMLDMESLMQTDEHNPGEENGTGQRSAPPQGNTGVA